MPAKCRHSWADSVEILRAFLPYRDSSSALTPHHAIHPRDRHRRHVYHLRICETAPSAPPKRIPIPGITLTDAERTELTNGASALRRDIDQLARDLSAEPKLIALLPDVEIFHKAVDWALRYDEFMAPKEIAFARTLLQQGAQRVTQLRAKQAPWLDATGLVVRGYRSKLDGSIQPYGLSVPETLPRSTGETPLLVWLLGRGEKRTELAFLAERENSPPQLTPKNTLAVTRMAGSATRQSSPARSMYLKRSPPFARSIASIRTASPSRVSRWVAAARGISRRTIRLVGRRIAGRRVRGNAHLHQGFRSEQGNATRVGTAPVAPI